MVELIRIAEDEVVQRQQRLLAHLLEQRLPGVVLFDAYYLLYYTDFAFIPTERPMAFVMNWRGDRALYVPRLELEHARGEAVVDRVETYPEYPGETHPMAGLASLLRDMSLRGKVGVDTDGYPWVLGYQGPPLSQAAGVGVEPLAAFVEAQMAVKSPAEVALLRESARWAERAHHLLQKYTRVGATETETSLRASQEATLALVGALGPAYRARSMFAEGATAGYRGQIGRGGAIPHALAANVTFQPGDVVVTGATAPMWGYQAELERTMVLGTPGDEQRRFFDHMVGLQDAALRRIGPGVSCAEVDLAVRAYFDKHDLWPYWKHHTGHGIGLRYHEGPFFDIGDRTLLRPGMVLTVEPGLYVAGLGGFRHSDTVLVTASGCELLTDYPRDLASLTLPA